MTAESEPQVLPVSPVDLVDLIAKAPSALRFAAEVPRAAVGLQMMMAAAPLLPVAPKGDGHPVLVLPGLGAGDITTLPLRRFLRCRGYHPYGWHLGRNVGPTAAVLAELPAAVERITARRGAKVSLIGWSLGGIFARELAHRFPDHVRQVITLASPYRLQRVKQSRVEPFYDRFSHLHMAADEQSVSITGRSRLPLSVPSTSFYSREDGFVAWQHCVEPTTALAENIRTLSSHLSIGFDPQVFYAIADRLAQPEGQWQPFTAPAVLRPFFPSADDPHGVSDVA
ncbi:lipase family alpha/beta hydrolase [Calidifontibacter terrae]